MKKRWQYTGKGLGSEVTLTAIGDTSRPIPLLLENLVSQIQTFEQRFSRFLPTSELSHVNARAGKKTEISKQFADMLRCACLFHQTTNGLYNPLLLPDLQKAGYIGSWPNPQTIIPSLDYRQRRTASPESLRFGDDWIQLLPETALDFGGIGKGYLLDSLTEKALQADLQHFCFSLGGDIMCYGSDLNQTGWKIPIAQAFGESSIETIATHGQQMAIATSGITKRRGTHWHHIIDPRTKQPAITSILCATVCHNSAAAADVFAKTLVLLDVAAATQFALYKRLKIFLQTTNIQEPFVRLGDY